MKEDRPKMKTQITFNSMANRARPVLAGSLALAALLLPGVAAAIEDKSAATASVTPPAPAPAVAAPALPAPTATPAMPAPAAPAPVVSEADRPDGSLKWTPGADTSRWSLNFTPVLVMAEGNYRLGGGVDPELKYTLDRGGVCLSAGLRVGGYYAKNLFGITTMPTIRLMVPVGPVEPYVSFGMGYGWLPKLDHSDIATMSRLGVVFRFSKSFALGVEGTVQRIEGSEFKFPSFGSALAINF